MVLLVNTAPSHGTSGLLWRQSKTFSSTIVAFRVWTTQIDFIVLRKTIVVAQPQNLKAPFLWPLPSQFYMRRKGNGYKFILNTTLMPSYVQYFPVNLPYILISRTSAAVVPTTDSLIAASLDSSALRDLAAFSKSVLATSGTDPVLADPNCLVPSSP